MQQFLQSLSLDEGIGQLSKMLAGPLFGTIAGALLVLIGSLIVMRILTSVADKVLQRSKLDDGLHSFILSLLRAVLWCVTATFVAGAVGIQTSSLVALIGVVGLAASLALQGTLTNIASGATLMIVKPFVVGDFIEVPPLNGTVTQVGLYYTTLRTNDSKHIFLPNSELVKARIINYSRNPTRRVEALYVVSGSADIVQVKQALIEAAGHVPSVLNDPPPYAGVSTFRGQNIEYTLRVWVDNSKYASILHDINEAVRHQFNERGISMH